MMNNIEFERRARAAATKMTTYLMGGFGCRLGKDWYDANYAWNKKHAAELEAKKNTKPLTFGFDCVCLIKGILWGFVADETKECGGAKYESNGVPDCSVKQMREGCKDLSDDFDESKLIPGELVFLKDNSHVGIYVGDGEVIESTPAWKCGVQRTLLPSRNSSNYEGLPVRKWDLHGKSEYIDYTTATNTDADVVKLQTELADAKAKSMNKDVTIKTLQTQVKSLQTIINNVRKIVKE